MSGGAIFIISIPTEKHELALANRPRKLFERRQSFDTNDGWSSTERPSTPKIGAEYGTFTNPLAAYSLEQLNRGIANVVESTTIDIASTDNSPTASDVPQRHGKGETMYKQVLQRSKSDDRNLNQSPEIFDGALNVADGQYTRSSWDDGHNKVQKRRSVSAHSSASKVSNKQTPHISSADRRSLQLSSDTSMEQIMVELLRKLKIDNAFWQLNRNKTSYQITFTIDDYRHEILLNILNEWGIGEREGSSVSMVPCPLYNKPNDMDTAADTSQDIDIALAQKQTAWNRFVNSVRARLNVAQIVHAVKHDATITFDFVMLLTIAAVLAAFGLVENSTVFLASSMLISPLMGPIIATIFGIVIKDKCLARLGLVNELIGISLATFVGFCFGLIFCWIDDRYAYGDYNGITTEMKDRGELHSVVLGILTAIPSGAAVAIAIIGENIGSLVGVAISASLLPPAVNSGILWSLSLVYLSHSGDSITYNRIINSTIYSENQAEELAIHGCVSMLITIVNVISIWIIGVIVLKIKEVAPVVSRGQRQFWKHDIKVARDYNKTCQSGEDLGLLAHDIADLHGDDGHMATARGADFLRVIDRASYQNTWSPNSNNRGDRSAKPTLAELEKLYVQMTRPIPEQAYTSCCYANTFMGKRSPPKYRSIEEQLFQPGGGALRRASMPFHSTFGMASNINMPTFQLRGPQLECINEVSCASCNNSSVAAANANAVDPVRPDNATDTSQPIPSTSNGNSKKSKFIVTPASDF